MSVNEKLYKLIAKKGIKQCYISACTGISEKKISSILRGKRKITADEFLRICVALNVEPNVFRN